MLSRKELANAIRFLSIDAVQQANSGHPGAPMGMADIAQVLWMDFLKHNPTNPEWVDRDRFVLSNGHASMLIYSLLHLTGYDVTIDDLKQFRQLHSRTPGHPELGFTPGVETTTGPLGQGLANAVGMAIAERLLASEFNTPEFNLVDHHTYVFMGDGCLMEGISHEACSLAGTLGLGKLIAFWDDNRISIDGDVQGWFTDNTPQRFEAYQWHVIKDVDGHDPDAIIKAIQAARAVTDKPSLICCRTQIGFGSPNKVNTADAHGAPLGDAEIQLTREKLNWQFGKFYIPENFYAAWDAKEKGKKSEMAWQAMYEQYCQKHPEKAAEFERRSKNQLPSELPAQILEFAESAQSKMENVATRKASLQALNFIGPKLPGLIGGSADLAHSNLTYWTGCKGISKNDFSGNYIYYGVREFAMCAVMNGMVIHKGVIPYGGTFLTFVDYGRNAVRMAALMKVQSIFVFTHDSIGLGEDGPTHQPIEHAAMLRMTPGLSVWRPCDATETAMAWRFALMHQGPTCLLLSRQNLSPQTRNHVRDIEKGGYILWEPATHPEYILIATGSEVEIAVKAAQQLATHGKQVRVVSMPSTDVFLQQSAQYQAEVLPPSVTKRIAIEAAASDYWYKFVGLTGKVIGLNRFGESAKAPEIFKALGFTVENIMDEVASLN